MEFKLPDIGEGVHEGEITKWLVKPGDSIQADQPMVEVMTDKATVEIPSPVAGVVEEVFAQEGQTVQVGKVLIKISEKGKSVPPLTPPAEAAPVKSAESNAPNRNVPSDAQKVADPNGVSSMQEAEPLPFHILATPATRKLARDLGVDLRSVTGTGPSSRVTKEDVKMAYEGHQAAVPRSSHPAPVAQSKAVTPAPPSSSSLKRSVVVERGALQIVPLKGVRKKIAEAMARSKHTAAHFTYVEEVDMSSVVKLRSAALDEAKRRNVKLTFLPFIIKAVIPALVEFPYLNSSLDDEKQEIILKGDYNIGIATDTPNGLMVPVIKSADRKSIWELAEEIAVLSEQARSGKIALDDLKGGTFTLTNAGSIGGVLTTPVINYPEVGILGVNAVRKRPIVKDDQIIIADMMYLSLSVDHRVADGADAARFVNRIVYYLTDPTRLVFA